MADAKAKFVLEAQDRTRGALRSVERRFDKLKRHLHSFRLLAAGAFGFAGVGAFARSLIDANLQAQKIVFTLQSVTGTAAGAQKEFAFLATISKRLGLDLSSSAAGYARLAASAKEAGLSTQALHQGFAGLSEALTVLHAPADEVQRILVQLDQGLSLGRIQMQDLRAISNSLPGVFGDVEEAFKGTGKTLQGMLENGGIPANEFFRRFTALLHDKYGPAAEEASHGLNAALNRLKTTLFETELEASGGTFLSGLSEAIDTLTREIQKPGTLKALSDLAGAIGLTAAAGTQALTIFDEIGQGVGLLAAKIAGAADPTDRLDVVNKQIERTRRHLGDLKRGLTPFQKILTRYGYRDRETIDQLQRRLEILQGARRQIKASGGVSPFVAHHGANKTGAGAARQQAAAAAKAQARQGEARAKAAAARQGEIRQTIAALRQEAATYGLSADQIKLYELAQQGASAAQIKAAGAAIRNKQAQQQAAAAAKAQAKAEKALQQRLDDRVARQQRQAGKIKDQLDPGRVRRRKVAAARAQARALVRVHRLTQAQAKAYVKLVEGGHKAVSQLDQFVVQAARNMEQNFSDFFFDAFQGKLDNLGGEFKRVLDRMAADALAAQLGAKLFGKGFASGKGGLGGLVGKGVDYAKRYGGQVLASVLHGGGTVGADGGTRPVQVASVRDLPRFHQGGNVAGIQPDERLAVLQTGERVLSRRQAAQHGQGRAVQVTNNFHVAGGGRIGETSQHEIAARTGEAVQRALQRNR